MTAAEIKDNRGAFGRIHANGDNYPKWLHGRITDVDRTMVELTDNSGFIHLFKIAKVVEFRPVAIRKIGWKMPKKFITK